MAFRFKLDEPVTKGLRRLTREQFNIALGELNAAAVEPSGVHQTRKVLKRLRGLLRLVGPSIGAKAQRKHNAALRDIGRLLAGRRDQAVVIETLRKLATDAGAEHRAVLDRLAARLDAPHRDLSGPLEVDVRDEVRARLTKEAKAFAKLKPERKGFAAFERGLETSYRAARFALKQAYRKTSDDHAFHELRKTVQTHWRQMSLLARAWPETLDVRIAAARDLSQILGDDHDLFMLVAHVNADAIPDAAEKALVEKLARERQTALRQEAGPKLERLFCEPPKAFVHRMASYWKAARQMPADRERPAAALSPATSSVIRMTTDSTGDNAADTPNVAAKTPARSPSQRRR